MGLVDMHDDDKATLDAEDEAIRNADKLPAEEPAIPTGSALQKLIEDAISGTPTPVHRQGQG